MQAQDLIWMDPHAVYDGQVIGIGEVDLMILMRSQFAEEI